MTTIENLSVRDLDVQLAPAYRRVLKRFMGHNEVSHVICYLSPLSSSPRLVPVGKGLEFESVDAANARYSRSSSEAFIVELSQSNNSMTSGDATSAVASEGIEQKTVSVSNELDSITEASDKPNLAELNEKIELLKRLEADLKLHEENLNSREKSLLQMEDELMSRLHQHMESVAELEQREDNLAEREASFNREVFKKAAT